MKSIFLASICGCLALLTGCDVWRSAEHYSQGTNFLVKDDYKRAISELECAVAFAPNLGHNHMNLAIAYTKAGKMDKAWNEYKEAFSCAYPESTDQISTQDFQRFYKTYVTDRGIDTIGNSKEYIEAQLGKPGMILANGDQYVYGTCVMIFNNGRLMHVSFIGDDSCLILSL